MNQTTSYSQDPIVRDNVVRAQEMHRNIEKGYNLGDAIANARGIYQDGVKIIKGEVVGKPIVAEELTPVMVELNKVSQLSQIQHNLHVLIPAVKAHRAMTELTWVELWRTRSQPVYTRDRDSLIQLAGRLKEILPPGAKVENGALITSAGVKYEVACLKHAAKCLSPADSVWKDLFIPAISAVEAVVKLNVSDFFKAIAQMTATVSKEWVSPWYIEMFPLEWKATAITTLAGFQTELEPHLQKLCERGKKYTLGLVKILMTIIENSESEANLKERAVEELIKLITIKPDYSISESLRHPSQVIDKLLSNPDRFADTRCFAAMNLFDLASQPQYQTYRPKIKQAIQNWHAIVKAKTSKRYLEEKREAEIRAAEIKKEMSSVEERINELRSIKPVQEIVMVKGPHTPSGIFHVKHIHVSVPITQTLATPEKDLKGEIDRHEAEKLRLNADLEKCSAAVKLGSAFEKLDNSECDMLDKLGGVMAQW